ncbi:MAG: hypothetical protein NZ919_02070 [Candidatus Caldarchaeum sp.]|nr:hypothetical protein [Candidatus Caldarchaeum sp.]
MGKINTTTIFLTAAALALLVFFGSFAVLPFGGKPVVVFSAPTLRGISDELAEKSSKSVDVQVHGSVFAANLIRSGRVPDLFLSVDSELKAGLNYRKERLIGIYRLVLVCTKVHKGIEALKTAKIGIADPNIAPVGYRALAAIYMISEKENLGVIDEVERSLNIKYVREQPNSLRLVAANIAPSGRFYMRPNLDVVGSLLEAGTVDCIFAHSPFVIARNLDKEYNVIELPDYSRFENNPPLEIYAELSTGLFKIIRLEAIALSFSEEGDLLMQLIDEIDVSKYGIKRVEPT